MESSTVVEASTPTMALETSSVAADSTTALTVRTPVSSESVWTYLGPILGCILLIVIIVFLVLYLIYRYQKSKEARRAEDVQASAWERHNRWSSGNRQPNTEETSCENPMYVIVPMAPRLPKPVVGRTPSNVTIHSELQKIVEYSRLQSFEAGRQEDTATIYESASVLDHDVDRRSLGEGSGIYASLRTISEPKTSGIFTIRDGQAPFFGHHSPSDALASHSPTAPRDPLPLCAAAFLPSMNAAYYDNAIAIEN